MPANRSFAWIVPLFLLCLACALPARAGVVEATLYPNGALVVEEATVPLAADGAFLNGVLTLPAQADPNTLSIQPPSGSKLRIAGTTVRSVQRRDEGRIKDVAARLAAAEAKLQATADALAAREGAAQFWRAQAGAALDKTAEAKAMASALRDGLSSELTAASALRREHARQEKTVKELRDELQRLTGGAETVHEVVAAFSGPSTGQVALRYSYRLRGAGWRPLYVLNAQPAANRIEFSWDAEVWQSSGLDWSGTPLHLATAEFRTGAFPPPLSPWELRPAPPVNLMSKAKRLHAPAATMALEADAAGGYAPRTEGTVFDTYALGRTDLPSGDRRRLSVGQETWKAEFDYMVRPHAEPRAYLRARVTLDTAPRIPSGAADFLLEGALVQKVPFELAEREAELFFGADPQIVVDYARLEDQSGESGFFGSKAKHVWNWRVRVENGKKTGVTVRVEDRLPAVGDERIKIKRFAADATVDEEEDVASWTFTLPPGGTRTVEYGYEAAWPSDMDLDLGGR